MTIYAGTRIYIFRRTNSKYSSGKDKWFFGCNAYLPSKISGIEYVIRFRVLNKGCHCNIRLRRKIFFYQIALFAASYFVIHSRPTRLQSCLLLLRTLDVVAVLLQSITLCIRSLFMSHHVALLCCSVIVCYNRMVVFPLVRRKLSQ